MKIVRYPVVIEDLEDEEDRLSPDLLDVDELQRDHPILFAQWVAKDIATWDGTDQAWLDRVALAQAYADPDGEWKRAADAIRLTDLLEAPWNMLAADVESRVAGAVTAALDVLIAVRDLSLELPSDIVGRDAIAIARLRALASVESIDLAESDYRFTCPGCGESVLNDEGGDDNMPLHCTACYAFGGEWQKVVDAEAAQ